MMNKAIVGLLAMLLMAACADETAKPDPVAVPTEPVVEAGQVVTPPSTSAAPTPVAAPALAPIPEPEYLSQEIPACTPVDGAAVDPCEQGLPRLDAGLASIGVGTAPFSIRQWIDGLDTTVAVAHVVVRGTYVPDSVRCEPTLVDRSPPWRGARDYGVESGLGLIQCFANIRANAYIVGTGPSTMTIMALRIGYWSTRMTEADIESELRGVERALRTGETGNTRMPVKAPSGGIGGREAIFFLSPALDHSYEVWQSWVPWNVQRNDDDSIVAVHPHRDYWMSEEERTGTPYRSQVEIPLANFITAAQQAHTDRLEEYGGKIKKDVLRMSNESLPMLETDANMLRDYHVAIENTTHADGPPVAPPPACGLAVPGHADNPGLVQDCEALLAAKDALRGTATLNWSVDVAIAEWDGVRTRGTGRVTDITLVQKSLTGTVPAELAELTGLQYLWLNLNQLTGTIPPELGSLPAIKSLLLNENQLTGPIPTELGNLTTLEALWLQSNQLSGAVPSQLAQLSNLKKLTLSSNALTGEIPTGLGSLSNLETLWLSHNQLTGNVPSELGNLSKLRKLTLSNNHLTGAIPTSLGDLADTLTELRMANNQLTGCIPAGLRGVAINDLDRLGLSDCTAS